MSRTVTTLLLDLAAWIAPPNRRGWIDAMRLEAGHTPEPLAWACGAVSTAAQERLVDLMTSGQALRFGLGGFVIVMAACALPVFPRMLNHALTGHLNDRDMAQLAAGAVLIAVATLLLLSGGLAVVFARRTSAFNTYGRVLFGLGGLCMGATRLDFGYIGITRFHRLLQSPGDILLVSEAPLFIAAATALLLRHTPLFVALASSLVAIEATQYIMGWPYIRAHEAADYFRAFFGECTPALVLLAASGLLIGRRRQAQA